MGLDALTVGLTSQLAKFPHTDDGGGAGRLQGEVLRGVGRDVAVGAAGDLLAVGALPVTATPNIQ